MAWSSGRKNLSVKSTTAHPPPGSGLSGRAPAVRTINFAPLEFFGATARCSHMHAINPSVVTPESHLVAALVEQHVDDVKADFEVEGSADNFKDFIKSYFAGTVAAGLAYLQMTRDGYTWSDHFEKAAPGIGGSRPDFVFVRPGSTDVALMESKGSRSGSPSAFDTTVETGYLQQVEPHLGTTVGASTATHGYCIGAWLKSTTKAELFIHHTDASGAATGGSGGPPASVVRGNYATALHLAHSRTLADELRQGFLNTSVFPFFEFEWIGRRFVTSWLVTKDADPCEFPSGFRRPRVAPSRAPFGFTGFAVDQEIVDTLLHQVTSTGFEPDTEINPLPDAAADAARDDGGALLPDGFAVVSEKSSIKELRPVLWDRESRQFQPPKF